MSSIMSLGPVQRQPKVVRGMSLFFIFRILVGITFLGVACYGVWKMNLVILGIAGGLVVLQGVLTGIQMAESSGCRCAVCTTPLFQSSRGRGGSINACAKGFLGSRRLYRSLEVLFASYYHCNHCGEKVKLYQEKAAEPQAASRSRYRVVELPAAPNRRAS